MRPKLPFPFSRNHHRQGDRAEFHRWCLWRESEANRVLVFGVEAVSVTAGEGNITGISESRGVQVSLDRLA